MLSETSDLLSQSYNLYSITTQARRAVLGLKLGQELSSKLSSFQSTIYYATAISEDLSFNIPLLCLEEDDQDFKSYRILNSQGSSPHLLHRVIEGNAHIYKCYTAEPPLFSKLEQTRKAHSTDWVMHPDDHSDLSLSLGQTGLSKLDPSAHISQDLFDS